MNTENDFQSNKKISKGQEAWKALQILLIFVAVICALWGAVVCLLTYWAKASVERQKLPTSGDYYCEELDATLHIVDSSFYLRLQDGREQEVYPSVSGHIRDGSLEHVFDFNAVYMWNQKKDWIELEIDTYPEPFQEGKKYLFKRVSQDSVSSEGRCTMLT